MRTVLQQAFARSGLSIKKLSELATLPYSAAYGAVKGTTDPQLSTVQKICMVLHLELRPMEGAPKSKTGRSGL